MYFGVNICPILQIQRHLPASIHQCTCIAFLVNLDLRHHYQRKYSVPISTHTLTAFP